MSAPDAEGQAVLSRPIIGVSVVIFVFFCGYLFFFPTLPFFITELGGKESEIGILIGVSSLAAVLMRPIVGYAVDGYGRRPVLLSGLALFAVTSLLYNVVAAPAHLFPLRILTGACLAVVITAASTYLADVAPPNKRAEAMSYFGLANALAFAIGPAAGGFIITNSIFSGFDDLFTSRIGWLAGNKTGDFQFTTMFIIASVLALIAVAVTSRMPESRPADVGRRPPGLQDLLQKSAAPLAAVSFAVFFAFAALVTFMPLFAREQGLDNPGNLFITYAAGVLLMRVTVARYIDKYSRATVIVPGIAVVVLTMLIMAASVHWSMLFVATFVYGVGFGVFQPAMMAYVVDIVAPEERGRAVSTFNIGNDLGISAGAFALGLLVEALGYRAAFVGAAVMVTIGILIFIAVWRHHQAAAPVADARPA